MTETMNRTATWTNIGTSVLNAKNIDDVLREASLDYTVEKQKMQTENGLIIPGRVATIAKYEDGTERYLGDVSDRYEICQNRDAFSFVDEIHDDMKFLKAGETHNGMIYVIGQLPSIDVLGDEVTPHVILQNGHNGRFQMKSTIIPLRVVCQNQFNTAFKESPNTISIIHSQQLESKILMAKKLLSGAADYMEHFKSNAEMLAGVKCGREACIKIIEDYFMQNLKTEEMSQHQIDKVQEKISRMKIAYNAEDNQNFNGTVYGLVNAFTDYNTHKEIRPSDKSEDSKFLTVTFNPLALSAFTQFALERAVA